MIRESRQKPHAHHLVPLRPGCLQANREPGSPQTWREGGLDPRLEQAGSSEGAWGRTGMAMARLSDGCRTGQDPEVTWGLAGSLVGCPRQHWALPMAPCPSATRAITMLLVSGHPAPSRPAPAWLLKLFPRGRKGPSLLGLDTSWTHALWWLEGGQQEGTGPSTCIRGEQLQLREL